MGGVFRHLRPSSSRCCCCFLQPRTLREEIRLAISKQRVSPVLLLASSLSPATNRHVPINLCSMLALRLVVDFASKPVGRIPPRGHGRRLRARWPSPLPRGGQSTQEPQRLPPDGRVRAPAIASLLHTVRRRAAAAAEERLSTVVACNGRPG